ncbi:MAG: alpha/beta hydrolase [Phenylobacterium sp.]
MDRLIVQTSCGVLYLGGRLHADPATPALVAMGGIWTPGDFLHDLVDAFPDVSVVIIPLPGMGGSLTRTFDIATLTRSLDEALDTLFRHTPVVAYGVSTGSLVTLGLRSPQVRRKVALEPFFRTRPLWAFHETARKFLANAPDNRGARLAAEQIFGLTEGESEVVDRDYRTLLEGLKAPLDVILADQPLEPVRPLDGLPSLCSTEDRAALAAHPLVNVHAGPPNSGHDLGVTAEGARLVRSVLRRALDDAVEG